MSDDTEIRVTLARMEGKQDVTNERLNNVQTDIADVRRVQQAHANDIMALKADKSVREGRVMGVVTSGRIIAWLVGVFIGSGGAIALFEALK